MSRLLGPLSETISKVSWRDCALAEENTSGAGTAVLAARADTDFRKSRRFMESPECLLLGFPQRPCQISRRCSISINNWFAARIQNPREPLWGRSFLICIQ